MPPLSAGHAIHAYATPATPAEAIVLLMPHYAAAVTPIIAAATTADADAAELRYAAEAAPRPG